MEKKERKEGTKTYLHLQIKFRASLECITPCLKQNKMQQESQNLSSPPDTLPQTNPGLNAEDVKIKVQPGLGSLWAIKDHRDLHPD